MASTHAMQHKGRPSPTGAVSCHTLTFWARSLASATGTVRRDLHLGRRTLANEMCLLLPASSPNGAKLPFGADKVALPSGANRVQRAWRWSLGTWAQSPSSTTGGKTPSFLWLSGCLLYTGGEDYPWPSTAAPADLRIPRHFVQRPLTSLTWSLLFVNGAPRISFPSL